MNRKLVTVILGIGVIAGTLFGLNSGKSSPTGLTADWYYYAHSKA